jgi:hypothetical protein
MSKEEQPIISNRAKNFILSVIVPIILIVVSSFEFNKLQSSGAYEQAVQSYMRQNPGLAEENISLCMLCLFRGSYDNGNGAYTFRIIDRTGGEYKLVRCHVSIDNYKHTANCK